MIVNWHACLTLLFACLAPAGWGAPVGKVYDPLAVLPGSAATVKDLSVAGKEHEIPLRIFLPSSNAPSPVILFSHGLGGSREGSAYLGEHWAARGYVAVYVQHPGSDTSVWQDVPVRNRLKAMRQAANARNFLLRVGDIHAVLDQLDRWNGDKASVLAGRLDLSRIGMSGHSFGAVTTQAVSGQGMAPGAASGTDSRIRAAIMFSPSSPRMGNPKQAFGSVRIPWLLMTGTRDIAPIGGADLNSRLSVYPALPPGGKYELVLDGAQHSAFTDKPLPGDSGMRNPNHHRVILALSTAFWDAYLRGNKTAKVWLDGDGPRSVMEPQDHLQRK